MIHAKKLVAAALALCTFAVAGTALASVCIWNGVEYSTGAMVCMKGELMRCLPDGTWQSIPSRGACDGKPDGALPAGDTAEPLSSEE